MFMRFRGGGIGHKAMHERMPGYGSESHSLDVTDEEIDEDSDPEAEGVEDDNENTDSDAESEEESDWEEDEDEAANSADEENGGSDEYTVLGFAVL